MTKGIYSDAIKNTEWHKLPQELIESSAAILAECGIGRVRGKVGYPLPDAGIRSDTYRYSAQSSISESIVDWITANGNVDPFGHADMQESHYSTLTPDEIDAVKAYTLNSTPINHHLKNDGHGILDIHHNSQYAYSVDLDALHSAITKNRLPYHLTTYTGLKDHPFTATKSLGIFHTTGHLSTSLSPIVAHNFSLVNNPDAVSHILKIHNNKGANGLFVGFNEKLTPSPIELEYIIPHGTPIICHIVPEEVHDETGKLTHYVWSARR